MPQGAPYAVHALAIATAIVAVVAAVAVNFEGMKWLGRKYALHRRRLGGPVGRHHMLWLVFGLLGLHTLAMLVFGAGYWSLLRVPGAGSIDGVRSSGNRFGIVVQGDPRPALGEGNSFEGNTEHDTVVGGDLPVPDSPPPIP